ncbi:MAG: hypothetical protein IIZ25_12510, partial [Thermoguttaceae bacterium]|nr:hypothetical protein [Thermoguttaceae bacterium]
LGTCQSKSGEAIFTGTEDPDYQTILTYIARGRRYILGENNRYVMSFQSPNNGPDCPKRFVPRKDYIREMKRYGVLPPDFDPSTPVDPFELEERYFDIAVRHREPGEGK